LSPNLTLVGSSPTHGEVGVPRDPGIVLQAKAWPDFPVHVVGSPAMSVRVFELGSGSEIAGKQVQWFGHTASFAWHPLAPLEPNTTYVIHGAITTYEPLPAGVVGPLELDAQFTTSTAIAPPLELDDAITVELGREDFPVQTCANMCGSCQTTGTREGVAAHVRIPGVRGGYDAAGYESWTYLTDNAGASFAGPGESIAGGSLVKLMVHQMLTPGQPTMITVEVPDEALPYKPCFSVNIWDPAGRTLTPQTVCLEAMVPSEYVASQRAGEAGDANVPHDDRASCATGPSTSGSPWLLLLALGVAALRAAREAKRGGP
jgi:hypothetical protein